MNITLRALIALLVCAAPLQARLGESKDEIATRYGAGKLVKSTFSRCERFHYNNGKTEVYVYFHDGKSVHERIRINDDKLSDAQIEDILRKTSEDEHQWIPKRRDDAKKSHYWQRDDEKAEAHRDGERGKWIIIEDTGTLKSLGITDDPDL